MKSAVDQLLLLQRFGSSFYAYVFRAAQGTKISHARKRVLKDARRYLKAGGTRAGIIKTVLGVQKQTHDLLVDWYGERAVIGFGADGRVIRSLLEAVG